MAKFCKNCGAPIVEGAKFCESCGAVLDAAPPQQPVPPQPAPIYNPQPVGAAPPPPPAQPQPAPNYNPQPVGAVPPPIPMPMPGTPPPPGQQQYAPPPAQPQPAPNYNPQPIGAAQQQNKGGNKMPNFMPKQQLLAEAVNALNRPDQPWHVNVEGDAIVARWKWMDAVFFAPHEINEELKTYTFTVKLGDNGKYKTLDAKDDKSKGITMNGGTIGFGMSSSSFKGKASQKNVEYGIGLDNQTGSAGLVGFKYSTSLVKNSVCGYLESVGWKKAGLFG